MEKEYITNSPSQTKKMGNILAEEILKTAPKKGAFVLGLEGALGGGKTTFLKGFAKGLGIREKILSPTFVIMKRFSLHTSQFKNFYHIDCYRIKKSKEILTLGWEGTISKPTNIIAVEWAEKIKKILPRDTIKIEFSFINKNTRKITIDWY